MLERELANGPGRPEPLAELTLHWEILRDDANLPTGPFLATTRDTGRASSRPSAPASVPRKLGLRGSCGPGQQMSPPPTRLWAGERPGAGTGPHCQSAHGASGRAAAPRVSPSAAGLRGAHGPRCPGGSTHGGGAPAGALGTAVPALCCALGTPRGPAVHASLRKDAEKSPKPVGTSFCAEEAKSRWDRRKCPQKAGQGEGLVGGAGPYLSWLASSRDSRTLCSAGPDWDRSTFSSISSCGGTGRGQPAAPRGPAPWAPGGPSRPALGVRGRPARAGRCRSGRPFLVGRGAHGCLLSSSTGPRTHARPLECALGASQHPRTGGGRGKSTLNAPALPSTLLVMASHVPRRVPPQDGGLQADCVLGDTRSGAAAGAEERGEQAPARGPWVQGRDEAGGRAGPSRTQPLSWGDRTASPRSSPGRPALPPRPAAPGLDSGSPCTCTRLRVHTRAGRALAGAGVTLTSESIPSPRARALSQCGRRLHAESRLEFSVQMTQPDSCSVPLLSVGGRERLLCDNFVITLLVRTSLSSGAALRFNFLGNHYNS